MNEIREADRFECRVVSVIKNLMWKGVTVEEKGTKAGYISAELMVDLDISTAILLYRRQAGL